MTTLDNLRPESEDDQQRTQSMLTPLGAEPGRATQGTAGTGTPPLLRIVRGSQTGLTFTIAPGITTLGRGDGADIALDDTTVSRRHAELERTGDRIVVRDTGSLNGTYVNRQPIGTEVELADGDEVWTGKYRMLFAGR